MNLVSVMSKRMSGVDSYLSKMPSEARRAIDGLNSEIRQAIVMALNEHGQLRFSDLNVMLRISKQILAFHLNRLVETGIISHIYRGLPSGDGHSYYRLSELGESLLQGIEAAFIPPVRLTGGQFKAELVGNHQVVPLKGMVDFPEVHETKLLAFSQQLRSNHREEYSLFKYHRGETVVCNKT